MTLTTVLLDVAGGLGKKTQCTIASTTFLVLEPIGIKGTLISNETNTSRLKISN